MLAAVFCPTQTKKSMSLAKKINKITLAGWKISFEENPLGIAASGERVVSINIEKKGKEIGTGIAYDNFSDEIAEQKLDELFSMSKK